VFDEQTERNLAVLAELRDAGLDIVKAIKARVIQQAAEGIVDAKAGAAYSQVAKTVQQVIVLFDEIRGLREKRRAGLLSDRKAQAKKLVRSAIDREAQGGSGRLRTETERRELHVRLDNLFDYQVDFERFSVAEIVAKACKLFGVALDPALHWPEWSELRPEMPAKPAAEPPPASPAEPARRPVPLALSGASPLSLSGKTPPERPLDPGRKRGPP
jgi:hypothetical protein